MRELRRSKLVIREKKIKPISFNFKKFDKSASYRERALYILNGSSWSDSTGCAGKFRWVVSRC